MRHVRAAARPHVAAARLHTDSPATQGCSPATWNRSLGITRAHASQRLEPSLSGDEACAAALHDAKAAAAVVGAMAMYSSQLEQVEWSFY